MSIRKHFPKERPARSLLFHILIWALEILLVVLLAFGVSRLFFGTVTLQENSMEPTLSSGNILLIDRIAYRFGNPDRGDVIVYRTTDEASERPRVKRVIGLPGETLEIRNGQIVIDGNTLQEKNDLPIMIDPGLAGEPVTLAEDEYFVLGDNRNGSEDSRYASVGNIRRKRIVGKAWLKIWPLQNFGGL